MPEKTLLIYDGDCALCRASLDWVLQRDTRGAFISVPCRAAAERRLLAEGQNLQCQRALCVLLPDQRLFTGVDAVAHILRHLDGWHCAGALLMIPGIHGIARIIYALVSHNRRLISLLFGIHAQDTCGGDSCGK